MKRWISLLSLLLCMISFRTLTLRTTSDPARGAAIKRALPKRGTLGAVVIPRLQGTATLEDPGNRETLISESEKRDGGLGRGLVVCLDRFKGPCLEVYFQPDTLRIGGRAHLFRRP